jgi:DNA-binding transcriptional MerR regulator
MMGIEEAAKVLGLSDRQLRRRIEATEPLIAPYLRRGEKNRLLLDQGAVEILRAIEDRRATGRTLADAKAWVAVSVSGKQGSERGQEQREAAASAVPQSGEVAALRELIAELRDERDRLRAEVDRLLPLALPAPRRRSLWPFGRRAAPR